jgi:hypothetical protein
MDNVPHVKDLKKARALVGGGFLPEMCQLTISVLHLPCISISKDIRAAHAAD